MKLHFNDTSYNLPGTYVCPYCKERFRLRNTFDIHLKYGHCKDLLPQLN